jgi:hypothetical protein
MDQQPPPQPPQPSAPPAQPAWGQPPAAPVTQWVQPTAVATRGPVTGLSKVGAVILIANGILWTLLWGAFVVLGAAVMGSLDTIGGSAFKDTAGGAMAAVGIFFLVIAVLELIVGVGSWMGKEWGRIGGIVYSLVFGGVLLLFGLLALATPTTDGANATVGALIFLLFAAGYIYTLIVFAARWRGRSTA